MEIYWSHGGLHFKPESEEERSAMKVLYNSAHKTNHSPVVKDPRRPMAAGDGCSLLGGVSPQERPENFIADK